MISINPNLTTNAEGTFSTTLDGMMAGMAMDDPAIRYQLTGGQLAATETLPMFGGIVISEHLPPTGSLWDSSLQNSISRANQPRNTAPATAVRAAMGISVFNQNHAMINSVGNPVPQAGPGMLVNFYRFGSRARIPLALDPAFNLQVAVPGFPVMTPIFTTPVPTLFWSVINNWVSASAAAGGAGAFPLPDTINVIGYNYGNSMVVVYNAATGIANWNRQGDTILLEI